ncbi:translocon at the outer envelope membrane ofchloroplasts 34 [Striga asiatica]|uniref:Translocon at the outer envelope membrane ofchloroplasts 34 n=1 Tax=Striga asiatica TaxID=4170 RepID=A0A5A7Q2B6_STRAF|nr:translocon at the outer envelope membrane ofchloroplasts 34 [Striga asiatica]
MRMVSSLNVDLIGHHERLCEYKKDDLQRNVVKSGQFGDWLRGPIGDIWEGRERKSLSTQSPNPNFESSKGVSGEGEKASPSGTMGGKESRGSKSPIQGNVNAVDEDIVKSVELVRDGQSQGQERKESDVGGNQGAEIVAMVSEDIGENVFEDYNLIDVTVQQEEHKSAKNKNQRNFIRIARSKGVSGSEKGMGGDSSGHVVKGGDVGFKRKSSGVDSERLSPEEGNN